MSNSAVVIIPIYKSNPNHNELISLKQCIKILSKHPFSIVTHKNVDISLYKKLLADSEIRTGIRYFRKEYFNDIKGYNSLLISAKFYRSFKEFEYLLIYQLDAWVFQDNLNYWCSKGYDYIGAPWFDGWDKVTFDSKFLGIGNGGFSLRKVKSHIKFTSNPFLWINRNTIFNKCSKGDVYGLLKTVPKIIKRIIYNNLLIFKNKYSHNEDYFFSIIIANNFKSFKIPSIEEASMFSFEMNPNRLFEMTNGNLPFGCHAWGKNLDFWSKYITV